MRDRARVFIKSLTNDQPVRFLEVGIHEAETAVSVMTTMFPIGSQYFGIDIWDWGGTPIPEAKIVAVERLKKIGVAEWPHCCGDNGFWIDGDILSLVESGAIARKSLDIIYIDSSHKPDQTLLESTLCFELLRTGGFLLWDDYDAANYVMQEVRQAVDPFLRIYRGKLDVIDADYQLLARKR